jgi:hypothetical protein
MIESWAQMAYEKPSRVLLCYDLYPTHGKKVALCAVRQLSSN